MKEGEFNLIYCRKVFLGHWLCDILASNSQKYLMIQVRHLFRNFQRWKSLYTFLAWCLPKGRKHWLNIKFISEIAIRPEVTCGGINSLSRWCFPLSMSSRHSSRNSWDAALCSVGNKFGLHVMSSRKAIVWERKAASCSKSWKCLDTQCRRTLSTRIVAGELTTDSFRFLASTSGGSSLGLLEAEVAIAKAAAAVEVLLLTGRCKRFSEFLIIAFTI